MQEFSSVTASAYDADALTPLLSEKAAEGWEVISIVSAGTNIVAYLQRGDEAAATPAAAAPAVEEPADEEPVVEEAVDEEPVVEEAAAEPEEPAEETPAAVDEPSGWAQAPDADSSDVADGAGVAGAAAVAAAEPTVPAAEPVAEAASEPAVSPGLAAAEPAAAEPAVAEPAAVTAPQDESTVPAGWYADPSGRYELRYWDGSAWTEHVSRAGQQFTDPPVA